MSRNFPPRSSQSVDIGLLLLRLAFGGIMLFGHGWSKLMKFFGEGPIQFADVLGMGPTFSLVLTVFAEVFCALLVMLGLFTRGALVPLIITMLVAAFYIHIGDPFPKMEKAILYLVGYAALLLAGPGRYSIDHKLGRG